MDYNASDVSGLSAGIGIFAGLSYFTILVLYVIGLWKTFEKAGKPGWTALIPIYNWIILLEIIGKPTISGQLICWLKVLVKLKVLLLV